VKKNKKRSAFNSFFNALLPYFGVRGIRQHVVKRIISALVIGVIFLSAIYLHRYLFMFLMLTTLVGMITEWFDLVSKPKDLLLGLFLISISVSIVILTRFLQNYQIVLLFFLCLWINDSMAMVAGKKIGGPRIAPVVSPSKTYAGFICGVIASGIVGWLFSKYGDASFHKTSVIAFVPLYICCALIACIAFFSDLLVSYYKRQAKVKDTGVIIPGHGGVLDRFDSMILTGPMLLVYFI
jgi:phosphatidate cytidylyltransferase